MRSFFSVCLHSFPLTVVLPLLGVMGNVPGDAQGAGPAPEAAAKTPADWVNPQIDTSKSRWIFFSSACRPFGLVNLSPDTQPKGDWLAGYIYGSDTIYCFSHLHGWQLAGMPVTGDVDGRQGTGPPWNADGRPMVNPDLAKNGSPGIRKGVPVLKSPAPPPDRAQS